MGHFALFTAFGVSHPSGLLFLVMLMLWVVFFLTGTGLYFGVMFKRTTSAVMMNMGVGLALWLIGPIFLGLIASSAMRRDDSVETVLCLNPVIQAYVVSDGATSRNRYRDYSNYSSDYYSDDYSSDDYESYDWPDEDRSAGGTFGLMLISSTVMMLVGLLFIVRAKINLRKRI